ncbi:hypothetical protein KAU08_13115 [bacterium]|nr:hypothetical protein [bacterium]
MADIEKWTPGTNATDHFGNRLSNDLVFFQPPPDEIGEVIQAYSTMKMDITSEDPLSESNQKSPIRQIFDKTKNLAFILFLIYLAYLYFIKDDVRLVSILFGIFSLVVTIFFMVISFRRFFKPKYSCTFIGTQGGAVYKQKMDKTHKDEESTIILFKEFSKLTTTYDYDASYSSYPEAIRSLVGDSDVYRFVWEGDSGFQILHGGFDPETILDEKDNLYHFVLSLENSWTKYVTGHLIDELEMNGSLAFKLSSHEWFNLTKDNIEIHRLNETQKYKPSEIKRIYLDKNQGIIEFHQNAKGEFLKNNQYNFYISKVPNLRAFENLVRKLYGIECNIADRILEEMVRFKAILQRK